MAFFIMRKLMKEGEVGEEALLRKVAEELGDERAVELAKSTIEMLEEANLVIRDSTVRLSEDGKGLTEFLEEGFREALERGMKEGPEHVLRFFSALRKVLRL